MNDYANPGLAHAAPCSPFIRDLSKLNQTQLHFNSRFLFCGVTSIIHVQHPGLAWLSSQDLAGRPPKSLAPCDSIAVLQFSSAASARCTWQGREEKTGVSPAVSKTGGLNSRGPVPDGWKSPPKNSTRQLGTTWISLTTNVYNIKIVCALNFVCLDFHLACFSAHSMFLLDWHLFWLFMLTCIKKLRNTHLCHDGRIFSGI